MASDPEAQTQLARLLGDDALRTAGPEALRRAADEHFDRLVDGIVAEAAASDDVTDRESALSFVALRLQSLAGVLDGQQTSRLLEAVQERVNTW